MQTVDGKPAEDALRDSETRAQAVLDATVDAVVVIDERGSIETFNPAAEHMFGYAAREVLGRNVNVLMPEPYRREHDGYLANYLRTREKKIIGIGREVIGRRKDGTVFPVDLAVSETRLRERPIFVGVIRDITERNRAHETLRESKRELEIALAALLVQGEEVRTMTQQLWQSAKLATVGELAASIAHELNNPLATVSLRLESLLNQTALEDPRRRSLEIVDQELDRMGNLVANLLQFSRRGHRQISSVDVADELVKSLELVRDHLRSRSIQVTQDFSPDVPVIQADRQQLRQVFLNLLTNAGDAMPEGGLLTLLTFLARHSSGKPVVVIEFVDTGVGIPEEALPKVMEPFFTTKEEGKGTGLGLAICRRAIQEHGGTIQIASQVGKGTTIRITLPVGDGTNVDHFRGP